jgi:protoporphyrinogen/coproporphyrinogen III oxidase
MVLEASGSVAGKMGATRRDGFTINRGAQLFPSAYTETLRLARDAGLDGELEEFTPLIGVLRDGRAHALRGAGPGMALDGLRTPLLSARSKALLPKLAIDAFRMRRALRYPEQEARARWGGETVAEYCDRRLNAEIRDYLIDPLMQGLVLTDAKRMPVVDFFFTAANLLGSPMQRYPAGYAFLCEGLAERIGDVRLGSRVERVEHTRGGVEVVWNGPEGEREAEASGCVIAIPGPMVPAIHPGLDERRAEILTREIDQSVAFGVHLALSSPPAGELVALTVPSREMDGLATITFDHVSMPGSVPPGKGVASAYLTNDWCAPRRRLSDAELLAEVMPKVESLLPGISETVEFTEIDRWEPCTPLSVAGIHALIAELGRLSEPADPVQLAGDFTTYATVNACVISGEFAAARLSHSLDSSVSLLDVPVETG